MSKDKLQDYLAAIVCAILSGLWLWALTYTGVFFYRSPATGEHVAGMLISVGVLGAFALIIGVLIALTSDQWGQE